MPAAPKHLLQRYKVIEEIGRGAQGVVHRALDLATGATVAIKSSDGAQRAGLRREFALLAGLTHPNVVQALDLFDLGGATYLVQTLAPGQGFAEWARRDPAPVRLCRAIAAVLRALQFVHSRGLVHRDVKPHNLRVDARPIGRLPGVRLIDFGLASAAPDAHVVGTLGYAAPEVLAGGAAGATADIYSLGAVLFEALFERLPNPLLDPSVGTIDVPRLEGRGDLPAGPLLGELLADMLHPLPDQRPDAASALRTLEDVVGDTLQIGAEELAGPYFPRPPLVGRDDILDAIGRLLGEAAGGRGAAVRLDGGGKSAVVQAVVRQARLRSMTVLDAEAIGAEMAAAGVRLQGASVEQLVTRVVDRCIERSRAAPLLLALDGLDPTLPSVQQLLRQLARAQTFELRRCLLLWTGPLPDGLEPELSGAIVELRLAPLDDQQAAMVVSQMLHHLEPPPWLPELLRVARGDPRWITDLVRAQIEARLPETLTPPARSADPVRVAQGRLAVLDEQTRRVLVLIAHARAPVPVPVLREVAGSGTDEAVDALRQRELIDQDASGVRPASAALQRAIEQLPLEQGRLTELHRGYVVAWREHGVDHPRGDEHLAHHLLHAGDAGAAAPLLLRRAVVSDEELERALAGLASDDPQLGPLLARLARQRCARGELEAALALVERAPEAEATLLRAELLLDAGQPAGASAALEAVRSTGPAYQRLLARARFLQGDYPGAATAAEDGKRLLAEQPHEDPALAVELAVVAGLAAVYRGEAEQGYAGLRAAEQTAARLDQPLLLARLHNSLGIALQRLGRLDQAGPAYEACLAQARRSGDLRVAATAALNLGTNAHRQGRWAQALEHYRQAGVLATRADVGTTRISALANEANLLLTFGELETSEACLVRAEALGRSAGTPGLLGHLSLYFAELALTRGNVEQAEQRLARASEHFSDADRAGRDALDLASCELALAQRRPQAARRTALALLSRMDADDPDRWRAHLLAGKALLAEAGESGDGQATAAATQLEQALAAARACGSIERRWECHSLLARCYREVDAEAADFHAGRFERARAALRDRVPPPHRDAFDRREELERAARETPRGGGASAGGPSRRELSRLLELNKELNRRLPIDDLLLRVLDRAIEFTGAERGFVLLQDDERLRVAASRNVDREAVRRGVDKFSRSIAERAIAEDQPVVAADAMADARFSERLSVHGLKLRAVLCVPLRAGETTRGALYLDNRFRADAFHAGHVALVRAFADQAAIALFNASLLRDEAEHREALDRAKSELEALNHQLQSQVTRQGQHLSEISDRLRTQEEELVRRYNATNIIGQSKSMRELYAKLDRVADSDLSVVVQGESGTGKELVARAIHYMGPRSGAPFVTVNCGAVPASLLESELFGHVRGAFTDALRDRAGLFEIAGEGTLLLDEVGDMPAEMQVKLLRVLQEGSYRRVGDEHERRSRCRVLAASHRDLKRLVSQGAFREDLYYRLNVVSLEVPPLRERRVDIPQLVQHFLQATGCELTITPAAMGALIDYDWPGNVRQLQNELQRASVLATANIGLSDLSPELRAARRRTTRSSGATDEGLQQAVQDYERRLIEHALDRSGFNVSEAARELRLHRVALHRKIRKYRLERAALQ